MSLGIPSEDDLSGEDTPHHHWEWKHKPYKDASIPEDALRPTCLTKILWPGSRNPVVDSDVTEMHDWFYVIEYQAVVDRPGVSHQVSTSEESTTGEVLLSPVGAVIVVSVISALALAVSYPDFLGFLSR